MSCHLVCRFLSIEFLYFLCVQLQSADYPTPFPPDFLVRSDVLLFFGWCFKHRADFVWGVRVRRLLRLLPLISRPIYLFTFVLWVYLADLLIIGLPGIPLQIPIPPLFFLCVLNYIWFGEQKKKFREIVDVGSIEVLCFRRLSIRFAEFYSFHLVWLKCLWWPGAINV